MRHSLLVLLASATTLPACAHRPEWAIVEPVADSANYLWEIRAYHAGDLWLHIGDSLDVVLLRSICIPRRNGCWSREDSSVDVRWDVIRGRGLTVTPLPRGEWTLGPGSAGARIYGVAPGTFLLRARLRHQSLAESIVVASRDDTTHKVPARNLRPQFGPVWCREQMAPLLRAASDGRLSSPDSTWTRSIALRTGCIHDALPALVTYWRRPYGDALQAGVLKSATSDVLDAELYDAVVAVAADTAAPLRRRVDALQAMGPWMGGGCFIGITYPLALPNGVPDRASMSAGLIPHSGAEGRYSSVVQSARQHSLSPDTPGGERSVRRNASVGGRGAELPPHLYGRRQLKQSHDAVLTAAALLQA